MASGWPVQNIRMSALGWPFRAVHRWNHKSWGGRVSLIQAYFFTAFLARDRPKFSKYVLEVSPKKLKPDIRHFLCLRKLGAKMWNIPLINADFSSKFLSEPKPRFEDFSYSQESVSLMCETVLCSSWSDCVLTLSPYASRSCVKRRVTMKMVTRDLSQFQQTFRAWGPFARAT